MGKMADRGQNPIMLFWIHQDHLRADSSPKLLDLPQGITVRLRGRRQYAFRLREQIRRGRLKSGFLLSGDWMSTHESRPLRHQ